MTVDNFSEVAAYYENNIDQFLRFGGSGKVAAIHRQIWADGVYDTHGAFQYLNRSVLQEIRPVLAGESSHVIDLGCGVGGTATYIASHLGVKVTGVANSQRQIQIAINRARKLGLGINCRFIEADYLALPALSPSQAAVAIESFVHSPNAGAFFKAAASQLVTGGRLVVCDDFLASPAASLDQDAQRWLTKFKTGWHTPSLVTVSEAVNSAQHAGLRLVHSSDLTSNIMTSPWIVLVLMQVINFLPFKNAAIQNWQGGSALQICIKRGWTRYYSLTFEKEK